ncbi:hypothetical protein PPYR_14338 [Photinus pyralis]|uniref:G-protein coupled receptors family 2 profile 2 domain-containing protein n=1 Tax=Photinus pyralis TaxID=7054 RepID=A0A5N4A539_PHOPY|nr:corticotropin-releasing factor receptor 1-like [Photinus pyralis]KAB0792379.1 hypothetical protein PPYR_14338 [Photinus pyralis]
MQNKPLDPSDYQDTEVSKARRGCIERYGSGVLYENATAIYNSTGTFCPAYWDDILCWPITPANTFATIGCPTYIVGFDKPVNNATRQCMENGKWFFHDQFNKYWTNYSQCFGSDQPTVFVPLQDDLSKIYKDVVPILKIIPRIGYSISLCTLLVAFVIMFSIKRLHCPRNNLHMNLFASFIFRAFLSLLKDIIFVQGVGLSTNFKEKNGEALFLEDTQTNNWSCKLFTTLWEFVITANYSWILMEGLYLHNLIFRALFTDSFSKITLYIVLGWGLPILVIVPWVIARLFLDNSLCWTTHDKDRQTLLIIRIPTMLSIMINTILFIRIAKVLLSKLRSSESEEARRYQKWAKSTLVLVPLFGVHYAIFLGMSYYMGRNEIIELVWIICDQLFASFQGFFVAILYCFLNGEVKAELKPYLHTFYQYLFRRCCACLEDDFKTIKSRSSVCTMLSSTSLYNGVSSQGRHKVKWDCLHHTKPTSSVGKERNHECKTTVRSWHDISPRKVAKSAEYTTLAEKQKKLELYFNASSSEVDISPCVICESNSERSRSEPHLGMEMVTMLPEDN